MLKGKHCNLVKNRLCERELEKQTTIENRNVRTFGEIEKAKVKQSRD